MLPPNTVASPATFAMLLGCVLGIGFMIRFFIALTAEEGKIRVVHPVRPRGVQHGTDTFSEAPTVSPGAQVAMGILSITTAFASNPGRDKRTAARPPRIVTLAAQSRETDSATECVSRLAGVRVSAGD